MPDRNTKPTLDITSPVGMHTKMNPDLLEPTQLRVCNNSDYFGTFGAVRKVRGNRRVLSSIYREGNAAKPVSWLGFYKSQDFAGAIRKDLLAQMGTTIQRVNSDGTVTELKTGQPEGLFRDNEMFGRFMLITGQDPYKSGRRGDFLKYDGFKVAGWGVEAPGRNATVMEGFEDTSNFTTQSCTITAQEEVAWVDKAFKMVKTAGASSCSFQSLNNPGVAVNTTIEDRVELRLFIPQSEFRKIANVGTAISVYFGSDVNLNNNYYRYDFTIGQLQSGWNTLSFDFSTFPSGSVGQTVGLPDDNSLKSYKFEAFASSYGTPLEMTLYWDHLVSLDEGVATPTFSGTGAIFNAGAGQTWNWKVTYVNEDGIESNAGPASVAGDLTSSGSGLATDVVEDFDSTTGFSTNGTNSISLETTSKTEGTGSIELNKSDTGVTTGRIQKTTLSADLTNALDSILYLDVFLPTGDRSKLATNGLEVTLSDDTSFNNTMKFQFDRTEITEGDWTTLSMNLLAADDTNGAVDISDIKSIRIDWLFASASSTSSTLRVDNLRITETTNFASVELTNVPVSEDEGVVARNVYRTVAGGTDYLFVGRINDNSTTTFTDSVSDGALGTQTPPEEGLYNDNSGPPNCAMLKVWKRTVFMAGDPLNPNVLYFSRDDNPEAFPIINGFELDTPITGIFETSLGLVVTTENDLWRVIGDNPDYFVDKVRRNMGNVGFRACNETRLYGWATDRDGVRLFDLKDTNKISDVIRDQFDALNKENLRDAWSLHSRRHNLIMFVFKNASGTYDTAYIYQYGPNDEIRGGWWWKLSFPSDLEFLDAEEFEDSIGDFHVYAGGNDGMIYELFDEDTANWQNASGGQTAIELEMTTPYIRAGILGVELEGQTGRWKPIFVELRAKEKNGLSQQWTVQMDVATGVDDDQTVDDTETITFDFPAGRALQRYRTRSLTAAEYVRFTIKNAELDRDPTFFGLRLYNDVRPSQFTVVGDLPGGQG